MRAAFSRSFDIGEPILITDIYQVLKSVPSLLDVTKAKVVLREGSEYADSPVTIEESLSADGRYVIPPLDTVFEIKFPNKDIRGTIL